MAAGAGTAGIRSAISGWGTALPDARLTNADLERMVDTTDDWILERTGIRERRMAGAGETTATLAVAAGAAAIKHASLTPGDIDLLILATTTPEQPVPHTSAIVQAGLGVGGAAFDIANGCSGFVYSLVVGALVQQTGGFDAVLVVGAETLTRTIVDFSDRGTCVLFGDGAAAVVLRPVAGDGGPGLLAWDLGCDGSGAELIEVRAGGSRLPASAATLAAGEQWVKMDGPEVFRRAVRVMADSASIALGRAGMTVDDVDLLVPHQANGRIVDATARRLGIPPARTAKNVDRYGNTSAASVPLALAEAADGGRLRPGDVVLMTAVGAGLGWGSAVLRWGGAPG
ncbi:MAG: beta-ketoacyl-ACP synthase III [Acidimicrobiia bacterium]